ncbi:peptidoglycan DD-metalloendopeptidase family protein [Hymenobacter sp. HMF4947]|uniref:Peptidoglycan DD-metalloendopeptidase family protein n=1 Tax=Hymenobacter ginkgonis TaxID=2682976 RepID=A0A7K1TCS7_9BACT|nr:urea transporter [Hymenobacter ginkgonis]MVN76216.1 peptidoglycan DD-metalloendopeptidase family protein [Hymenobacter ginkgonis]
MPAFFRAVLHSYSMLFFSQHRGLAALLLLATWAHPWAGAAGLAAAALAVGGARLGGFSREYTDLGAYSFNALLVGLALPLYFAPSAGLAALVGLGAGLALLLSVALGGWLGGRGLPFLSLPFILVMWLLLLASRQLPLVPAEAGGVYWLNDAYALGGPHLANAARWATEADWPPPAATYLRALSAVLLQDSPWAGLLVALGLLWHSRIAFSLSVLAFGGAWGLALLAGAGVGGVGGVGAYDLGANYLMAAVAVGGVFALPSLGSYGWSLLSLPVTAVLLAAAEALLRPLGPAGLPALSLPYCLTSLLFLYVLLLREKPGNWLVLTPLQRYSPEANLYAHLAGLGRRAAALAPVPLALPFLGEWRCTQGYADGGPTHQGPWGQALDFAITDKEGQTYEGSGRTLSDFYCYDKPVLAPADGTVEEVVQHLPDNAIGEVDTRQNWGNTVVLRHAPGLYSQLSHLRAYSVRVRPGQAVRRGEVLASCGSSGRSPEPHLHFQLQATPAIGSPTLAYPLAHFLASDGSLKGSESIGNKPDCLCQSALTLHTATVPRTGELVRPPQPQAQLSQALHLPPGQRLAVQLASAPEAPPQVWEVFTDAYNARYLRCHYTGAVAYFEQDEAVFQCTAYYGSRQAWLYWFYLAAYRVPLCYLPQPRAVPLPLSVVRRPWLGWLQDVVAPFFQFVQPVFTLKWLGPDAGPAARQLQLGSRVVVSYFGQKQVVQEAELTIADGALTSLTARRGAQQLALTFAAANS